MTTPVTASSNALGFPLAVATWIREMKSLEIVSDSLGEVNLLSKVEAGILAGGVKSFETGFIMKNTKMKPQDFCYLL